MGVSEGSCHNHVREGGDWGKDVGTGSSDYGYIWKDLLMGWVGVGYEEKE